MTNLRNKADYLSTIWDWTTYNDCFNPTKIRMTDIDGFVERHGQFLLIETKRPGAKIPMGQNIMFNSMVDTGIFTVVIVWGKTNKPERAMVMRHASQPHEAPCNTDGLKRIIKSWFDRINIKGRDKLSTIDDIISIALEIQSGYLVCDVDLSQLAGAIVQKAYQMKSIIESD